MLTSSALCAVCQCVQRSALASPPAVGPAPHLLSCWWQVGRRDLLEAVFIPLSPAAGSFSVGSAWYTKVPVETLAVKMGCSCPLPGGASCLPGAPHSTPAYQEAGRRPSLAKLWNQGPYHPLLLVAEHSDHFLCTELNTGCV